MRYTKNKKIINFINSPTAEKTAFHPPSKDTNTIKAITI